jgi:hypothetical protein
MQTLVVHEGGQRCRPWRCTRGTKVQTLEVHEEEEGNARHAVLHPAHRPTVQRHTRLIIILSGVTVGPQLGKIFLSIYNV